MSESTFLESQRAGVDDARVRDVNGFVRKLRKEHPDTGVPFIAPHYNGANARVLVLSSNPGPKATEPAGSGFLSRENRDFSAMRMSQVCEAVGLSDEDAIPWNVCPWDVHEQVKADGTLPTPLIREGLEPLRELFDVCPRIRVVIAHGTDAKRAMRLFLNPKHYGAFAEERELQVFETRHTSPRWFNSIGPVRRDEEMRLMRQVYRDAMASAGIPSINEPLAGSVPAPGPEFPEGLFGYVPPWLPQVIGRIVMVASLLETRTGALLMNLSRSPQSRYAGKPVSTIIDEARNRLGKLDVDHSDTVARALSLLSDVEVALNRRNAIVHNLWPDNTYELVRGWRDVPPSQREPASDTVTDAKWTAWIEAGNTDLSALVEELTDLVRRMSDMVAEAGSIPPNELTV
ncbi:MAG: hypothetical protein JWP32_2353 [Schumannella sp.]|nr:hypothetical protein [Schumannella sp.]